MESKQGKSEGAHPVDGSVSVKIKRESESEQVKSEMCSPCGWKCQWQNKKGK